MYTSARWQTSSRAKIVLTPYIEMMEQDFRNKFIGIYKQRLPVCII